MVYGGCIDRFLSDRRILVGFLEGSSAGCMEGFIVDGLVDGWDCWVGV